MVDLKNSELKKLAKSQKITCLENVVLCSVSYCVSMAYETMTIETLIIFLTYCY